MNDRRYTLDVKYNEDGEAFIELPKEITDTLSLNVGDDVKWVDNNDGSFTLQKVEKRTKMVMVEAISQFRMRYVVELEADSPNEWACDTVVCEDAKEFSQVFLGETVVSHREITREEFLKMHDEDHDYLRTWSDDTKLKNGLTELGYKAER